MNMNRYFKSFVAAALVCSTLAGCGSSSGGSTAEKTASSSTAAASGKHFVIATDTVFKPFEYTDADGNFVGIDVDLLAAIAKDQGFTYDLNSLGWDSAIAACQAGQADGMIAGASITDERKKNGWIFSDGYYTATQCVAVAADSDVKSLDDLQGANVAVKTGTAGADYANSLKDKYNFNITTYEDSPTMYQAVTGGQVVCMLRGYPDHAYTIKQGTGSQDVEGSEKRRYSSYGFGSFDGSQELIHETFNAGLADIKANGNYDQIIAKYLG